MSPILEVVAAVAEDLDQEIYLAGGCLRDMFLFGSTADYDFAVRGDVKDFASNLAARLHGTSFPLGREQGCYRVAVKGDEGLTELDFSPFRAEGIEGDLKGRDFTVNAMALSVKDLFRNQVTPLIDPLSGMSDLSSRALKLVSRDAVDDDPLRILRGFRMAASFKLKMDEEFLSLARVKATSLMSVSAERIRAELFKILQSDQASHILETMVDISLLEEIIPEISKWDKMDQESHHRFDLLRHALKTVFYLETILSEKSSLPESYWESIVSHLGENLEYAIDRKSMLKFAALLHDSGKPSCLNWDDEKVTFYGHDEEGAKINKTISRRLKMGNRAGTVLENITSQHMRVLHLSRLDSLSKRAVERFIRDCGDETIEVLLLSLADAWATRDARDLDYTDVEEVVRSLMERYLESPPSPVCPLLEGGEVMDLLGIPQGEEVGYFLSLLVEAQIDGNVKTKNEARAFLKEKSTENP